jgi:hypothetical protein
MPGLFDRPVEQIFYWAQFVFHPLESTVTLLRDDPSILFPKKLIDIWVASVLVYLFTIWPIAYLFGISIKDVDFLAIWGATLVVSQILFAFVTHCMLRLMRQKSTLAYTLRLYTIIIIYWPVVLIFQLPGMYNLYLGVRFIKESKSDILTVLKSGAMILPTSDLCEQTGRRRANRCLCVGSLHLSHLYGMCHSVVCKFPISDILRNL